MPSVRDILTAKGAKVLSVQPDATVLQAAEIMNQHRVGSLVVLSGEQLAGMFTERDVLTRVVVARRDPDATRVSEVMTTEVVCCRPHTSLDEARTVMKERRIRHLPVLEDDGRLLGLVSIGDLNAHDAKSIEVTVHMLHEYIQGRT